jgi:hypothetical protein
MLLGITLDNSPNAIGISKKKVAPGAKRTSYFTNKKMRQLFGQKDTDYMDISLSESLKKCEKFIRNKKEWRNFLNRHSTKLTKGSMFIRHTNGKEYKWTSENLLDNDGKPWGRMAVVKAVGKGRRKEDE